MCTYSACGRKKSSSCRMKELGRRERRSRERVVLPEEEGPEMAMTVAFAFGADAEVDDEGREGGG
jgi:hypothetical protein